MLGQIGYFIVWPMKTPLPINDLIARLRMGDEDAVRELVAGYEPYLRRTLRRRLARTPFQAIADSADVCQSVLCSFLVRIAAGEYVVKSREDLVRLLTGMARKKLAALIRRESAQRRDRRRTISLGSNRDVPADPADEPSLVMSSRDLLANVSQRLPEAERLLFEQRRQGKSWQEIADLMGDSPIKLRKRLSRALRQASVELGLENDDE